MLLLADRHNVFSTADARALGYTTRVITRMVHTRQWVRLRRGWYTLGWLWDAADARAKHVLTARAVMRPLAGRVALTRTSGAVALGLEMWRPTLDTISVVRLDGRRGAVEHGVTHHEQPREMGPCLQLDDDLVVAPPTWTVATAMMDASLEGAVVIADSALNRLVSSKPELDDLAESWQRWPGSRPLRLAVRLADGRAANGGETLGRIVVFWRFGLPRPELQYEVHGPNGEVAFTDWAWPERNVLGEFDGKRKYMRDALPEEEPGEVVWREKLREDWIAAATDTVMRRMIFRDIFRPAQTAERFRQALERGERRRSA